MSQSAEYAVDRSDVNLSKEASECARTQSGADFVLKATHPPMQTPANYAGVPDGSADNYTPIEVKSEVVFSPKFQFPLEDGPAGAVYEGNATDVLFVCPGGEPSVASYVFVKMPNGEWTQPQSYEAGAAIPGYPKVTSSAPPATLNTGYNFKNVNKDMSKFRSTVNYDTIELVGNAFNNQGRIGVTDFNPRLLVSNGTTELNINMLRNIHRDCPESLKSFNKAIAASEPFVKIGKRADLRDDATFNYAAQIWELENPKGTGEISRILESPSIRVKDLLPNDLTDVLNLSTKAVSWEAKQGSFTVSQKQGPNWNWVDIPVNYAVERPIDGPVISLMRTRAASGSYQYGALYSSNVLSDNDPTTNREYIHTAAMPWNNLNWHYVLFQGLSVPQSTVDGIKLSVKGGAMFEGRPCNGSSLQAFMKQLAPPDRCAIESYEMAFHQRKAALPASANSLGSILLAGLKYLPSVVSIAKGLFSASKGKQTRTINRIGNWVAGPVRYKPLPNPQSNQSKRQKSTPNIKKDVKKLEKDMKKVKVQPKNSAKDSIKRHQKYN